MIRLNLNQSTKDLFGTRRCRRIGESFVRLNREFFAAMALLQVGIAIIAGILFATFLTLILVPVMYSLVDDFSDLFQKYYVYDKGESTESDDQVEVREDGTVRGRPVMPVPSVPEPVGAHRSMGSGSGLLDPQPEAVEHYRAQIQSYLRTTGLTKGLLVFVTRGTVVEVS